MECFCTEENFGKIEKTKYMTCTGDQYYENDKSTAFGRDYANGLSFIGILPNDEGDFTLEDLDISGLLKSNQNMMQLTARCQNLTLKRAPF